MSLVLLKPDAFGRQLVGPLISEYERQWQIVRAEIRRPPEQFWRRHYREHVDQPYWRGLLIHMTSGRVMAMIIGANPIDVREFSLDLRKRYGAKAGPANLVHASTAKDCIYEMDLWFPGQLQ